MDSLSYKTKFANKQTVTKGWIIVDADAKVLGRLASEVARIIRGKHKAEFTPHVNCGDNVIVINADKIRLTGKKLTDKQYIRHTGYPGGQRFLSPQVILRKKGGKDIVEKAVRGMLPKNKLGREMFHNLHVFNGPEHPHEAQKPKELKLNK